MVEIISKKTSDTQKKGRQEGQQAYRMRESKKRARSNHIFQMFYVLAGEGDPEEVELMKGKRRAGQRAQG